MLMRLLALIGRGGMQSSTGLAAELGVTTGLLQAMVDELTRMGYLTQVANDCRATACSNCASSCLQQVTGGGEVWLLTDKGRQAPFN